MHCDVGPARLHEGHHLPLVVGGASPDDFLAALPLIGEVRLEGRRRPQVEGVDGLHVVMAVEQDVRRARLRLVGQHDRMERGLLDGGLEAQRGQVLGEPGGGLAALAGIGGIGGDRRDPQEGEQPLQGVLEIRVDVVEDRVERGHRGLRGAAGTLRDEG